MPDFLTRRNSTWHFVRRAPNEFARLDKRGVVKHSTRIKIADDRAGRRTARVADRLNLQLELYWKSLADCKPKEELVNYEVREQNERALDALVHGKLGFRFGGHHQRTCRHRAVDSIHRVGPSYSDHAIVRSAFH